jgi:hypothetical protein
MTVTVANTANTNTFDYWRNRTNELAYAMSTYAVTAGGSNTAVGNAAISGIFNANTIVVGNSSVNVSIVTSNSVQQSNGQYYLNANGTWTLVSAPTYVGTVNTSSTSANVIDYYSFSTYNAVEYMVFVKDNNANNSLSTKIATMSTSVGGVYYTEYATLLSNSSIGTFVANANATHTKLNFTPTSSNTTVKFLRYNI